MTGVVADENVAGYVFGMVRWLAASDVAPLWDDLGLGCYSFADRGWPTDLPDRDVWGRCQADGLVLVTNNRNHDDDTSLEATLRDSLLPDSLPVLTFSRLDRFVSDAGYAERTAVDLLDVLLDLAAGRRWLGVGRVFIPHARPK